MCDAVVAIERRYEPYKLHLKHRTCAPVAAVVAAAAHDVVLATYFIRGDLGLKLAVLPANPL